MVVQRFNDPISLLVSSSRDRRSTSISYLRVDTVFGFLVPLFSYQAIPVSFSDLNSFRPTLFFVVKLSRSTTSEDRFVWTLKDYELPIQTVTESDDPLEEIKESIKKLRPSSRLLTHSRPDRISLWVWFSEMTISPEVRRQPSSRHSMTDWTSKNTTLFLSYPFYSF